MDYVVCTVKTVYEYACVLIKNERKNDYDFLLLHFSSAHLLCQIPWPVYSVAHEQ